MLNIKNIGLIGKYNSSDILPYIVKLSKFLEDLKLTVFLLYSSVLFYIFVPQFVGSPQLLLLNLLVFPYVFGPPTIVAVFDF